MKTSSWFTKLMKSEPHSRKKKRVAWIIDESKCLRIKEVRQLRTTCTELKLIGIREGRFKLIRDWFMTELSLNAGLRVEEMTNLQHKHLFVEGEESSIVVFGKGQKKRLVWMNTKFKGICKKYVSYKKKFGFSCDDESFLLNNLKGERISKRSLQKFFKEILLKADLPLRYHIHCLRHTYATFILKATNNDYRFLQDQLGHASITTTQVYAGIIESDKRGNLEQLYR